MDRQSDPLFELTLRVQRSALSCLAKCYALDLLRLLPADPAAVTWLSWDTLGAVFHVGSPSRIRRYLGAYKAAGLIDYHVALGLVTLRLAGQAPVKRSAFASAARSPQPPLTGGPVEAVYLAQNAVARDRQDILAYLAERDGHGCAHCGSQEALQIDHIIPLSKGGPNAPDNWQLLCAQCNQAKGTTTADFRHSQDRS